MWAGLPGVLHYQADHSGVIPKKHHAPGMVLPEGLAVVEQAVKPCRHQQHPRRLYNSPMSDDLNMDFFFPELSADGQNLPVPPAEMCFLELRAEPVLDEGPLRTRVYVEVTPFQQRPYIEVVLAGADGSEIASASIIEPLQRKNVFTLHLRGAQKSGQFSLHARLYYPDGPAADSRTIQFEI